jgi:hypothetical protein
LRQQLVRVDGWLWRIPQVGRSSTKYSQRVNYIIRLMQVSFMSRLCEHFVFYLIIVLCFTILLIEFAHAQTNQVNTYCDIAVDHIVEGQPVVATIQMYPATPTGEGYKVFTWVTSPDGIGNKELNGAWVKNVLTDENGKVTVTFDVSTYTGKWYVDVSFGGSNFDNHTTLYSGGNWRTELTVSSADTSTSSIIPTPSSIVTPMSTSTANPTIPEFSFIAVLTLMLIIPLTLVFFVKKKLHCN